MATYITDIELNTYCTERGITPPITPLPLIQKATDYITAIYFDNLIGTKVSDTQELLFPRVDDYGMAIDETSLKKAVCALALRAIDAPLFEDITKRVIEETLDVLTVKYDAKTSHKTQYSDINTLMRPYLISSTNTLKAVR